MICCLFFLRCIKKLGLADFVKLFTIKEAQEKGVNRFINPGEIYFGGSECKIHTILGSCIAITLWHPERRVGGMCHFVLPTCANPQSLENNHRGLNGRYADQALKLLEREAMRLKSELCEYQAKIFGGSNMLSSPTLNEDQLIGNRNAEAAMLELSQKGIPLLVADVGETGYRRIIFDVEQGDVWVKHEPLQKFICPDELKE